jgi:hypothetical protein
MKQFFLAILISILTLAGCSENKKAGGQKELTRNALQSLVMTATNGDKKANDSLSGLVDIQVPENNFYNSIEVDSFYLDSVKYFSILLEYPNSISNRFAIYDNATNCFLIDKSLNGKLSFEVIDVQNLRFLKIVERFIAKDTFGLVRLSLFRKLDNSINLVFRSFTELKTLKNQFNQTVYSVTSGTIKTKLLVPKKFKLDGKEDVFVFDETNKSYRSNQSSFDSLVYKEIAKFEYEPRRQQIE